MDNDSTLSQELLLSLKHPHVVELLDAFEGSSSLTVVTELLKGAVRMADF
jgi:serine/threonine protein kinase